MKESTHWNKIGILPDGVASSSSPDRSIRLHTVWHAALALRPVYWRPADHEEIFCLGSNFVLGLVPSECNASVARHTQKPQQKVPDRTGPNHHSLTATTMYSVHMYVRSVYVVGGAIVSYSRLSGEMEKGREREMMATWPRVLSPAGAAQRLWTLAWLSYWPKAVCWTDFYRTALFFWVSSSLDGTPTSSRVRISR